MNLDYKKLGLLVLIIAAAIGLGFLIYFFFFRGLVPATPVEQTGTTTTTSEFPPAGQGTGTTGGSAGGSFTDNTSGQATSSTTQTQTQPQTKTTSLTDTSAYFASTDKGGDVVYYNPMDGKFYRLSPTGQITTFSDKVFHNVSNVVWSNGKDKAILQYPDGTNIIYDFAQNKQINLQSHWSDFTFSPSDTQIAFKSIALDPENRYLAIGDTNGSNLKIIESIGGVEDKFQVNWSPNNSMVANFVDNNGMDRSEVYFVGLNNENFKSMTVEGRGFEGLWTPDGTAMVYSVYNTSDYVPTLWISGAGPDNIGANRNVVGLNTWADKCSFGDSTTLYCAVPQQIPYGAGLEPGLMAGVADDIYQVDLQTGAKKIISQNGTHQINKVFPLNNGKYILFSDAADGKIYRVEL